jgi:type I restriction enzyme, S subunit
VSAVPCVAIGDLAVPVGSWTPERDDPDGAFTYIDLSAVDQDAKTIMSARRLACAQAPSRARQVVRAGDVLISTVRPNLNAVARVPHDLDGATASTGFCVVRPSPEKLDGGYLFHWVRNPRFVGAMVRRATGASYPAVTDRAVLDSKLPVPPVREQRRIAEILDRADTLRAERRAALAQLDTLTQSVFQESFVEKSTCATHTLDSVCELITDGTHYTPTYSETGVIFLSSRNVTSGYINWDDVKYISANLHAELHRRVAPRMNDILLAKNGTTGIAAIVDRTSVFDIYVSLALLRPSKGMLPIFLREAINSPACTRQFNASLKGIGVPNLHLKEIRQTRVPVPPINLQCEFVERVQAIEKQKKIHLSSRVKLDVLFASLQHRAFRGEL